MWSYVICVTAISNCDTRNGGCQHNCDDSSGDVVCSCQGGFLLEADGMSCQGKTIILEVK